MWSSILLSKESGTNVWGKIQKDLAEIMGSTKVQELENSTVLIGSLELKT